MFRSTRQRWAVHKHGPCQHHKISGGGMRTGCTARRTVPRRVRGPQGGPQGAGRSRSGFTLLEALVVLALLGTLLALAAPSLSVLRQSHQMQSQGEQLLSSLMLARSEALRRQQRVTVCVRASGDACAGEGTWAQGWLVFVDGNDNARLDGSDVLLQSHAVAPSSWKLYGNTTVNRYVSYGPQGRSQTVTGAFQAGTLTLCRPGQSAIWEVVINAVGKPRLQTAVLKAGESC